MAETHLDCPGEIRWFAGHGPRSVVGLCPHDCQHELAVAIAWGPDFDHYVLEQCRGCGCRGWFAEYPPGHPKGRYRPVQVWSEVDHGGSS